MLKFMLSLGSAQAVYEYYIRVSMRIEIIKQAGLKRVEVDDVNRFLQNCVDKGYLLHGSNLFCEILEPRLGYCLTGLKENLQVAVYATISPLIAIFNAIRHNRRGYARYELIHGNTYLEVDRTLIESLGEGYVYVLDRSRFQQCRIEEGQFTSQEGIRPICVTKVTKRDLNYPIRLVNGH